MQNKIEQELKNWFKGADKVVIAGIGNPIRKDDYVGLKIVETLNSKVQNNVRLLECEIVPESYLQDIQDFQPTHVLLIDAAFLNLKAGDSKLVEPKEITCTAAYTSHLLPLRIFCELIQQTTKTKLALLLIQPGHVDFGEGLTGKVETTAHRVSTLLLELFGNKK
ncbi:MAG: hydrogenase maturation protease [Candidatus Bathyarchaeota archaeon]|nr:hydrogenase maturation protease [Candidatus Bathyarchaeota archaeon]